MELEVNKLADELEDEVAKLGLKLTYKEINKVTLLITKQVLKTYKENNIPILNNPNFKKWKSIWKTLKKRI